MVIFIEPHCDDFILSAGMYFLQNNPVDKVITVFNSNGNEETKNLCKFLEIKDYMDLGMCNLDWKHPIILFTITEIKNRLSFIRKEDTILTVLGVGNVAHKFLVEFLINTLDVNNFIFFRDFPHSYDRMKLKEIDFAFYTKNRFKLVNKYGDNPCFKTKIDLFKKFYPTQHSLLWFEREQFSSFVEEEAFRYNLIHKNLWI